MDNLFCTRGYNTRISRIGGYILTLELIPPSLLTLEVDSRRGDGNYVKLQLIRILILWENISNISNINFLLEKRKKYKVRTMWIFQRSFFFFLKNFICLNSSRYLSKGEEGIKLVKGNGETESSSINIFNVWLNRARYL